MNTETILMLLLCMAIMLVPIFFLALRYRIKAWKSLPIAFSVILIGTVGALLLSFVESSSFGGRSYYGAVFLIPLLFVYLAKWLKIPYGDLMDLCAPAGGVVLLVLKNQCIAAGCCGGKVLYYTVVGDPVYFPSQYAEMINGTILLIIVFVMAWRGKQRQNVYGWFMLLYGCTRFVLNWFRADSSQLLAGLPNGIVWSLVSIFFGLLWVTNRKLTIVKRNSEVDSPDPVAKISE